MTRVVRCMDGLLLARKKEGSLALGRCGCSLWPEESRPRQRLAAALFICGLPAFHPGVEEGVGGVLQDLWGAVRGEQFGLSGEGAQQGVRAVTPKEGIDVDVACFGL